MWEVCKTASIANLFVKIGADTSEFEKKMKSVSTNLQTTGQQMSNVGKSLAMGLTAPIVGVAAASFKMASDMSESVNKVDVAFGENAGQIKDWSKTTLESFGLAKGTALDMAAGFGDMATAMGFSTAGATTMSTSLVGLAGDLASFKNIGIGEATTALTAIFTGETESLKKMGIVMTQANLTAFAMSQGIQTNIADLTQAEQVQLRYNYVMEMTKNAQGDFARTSDGAANQMRIFTESLKETGAELGSQLLPIITPVIAKVNEWIKAFAQLDEGTKRNILIIGGLVAAIGPAMMIIGGLTSGIGSLMNGVSLASKALGAGQGLMGALSALIGPAGIALLAISAIAAIAFVVIKNWEPIKAFFSNMFLGISNGFESFKTGFINGWQALKDNVSNIYRGLVNNVIGAINTMVRGVNRIQFDIPSWVPMLGGKRFGFNIPELPSYEVGTPYVPQTGLALLHKGEAVIPANQNRSGGVTIIVELDGRQILRALDQPMADYIMLKTNMR